MGGQLFLVLFCTQAQELVGMFCSPVSFMGLRFCTPSAKLHPALADIATYSLHSTSPLLLAAPRRILEGSFKSMLPHGVSRCNVQLSA